MKTEKEDYIKILKGYYIHIKNLIIGILKTVKFSDFINTIIKISIGEIIKNCIEILF
jgi:hypothetical protein